MEREQHVQRPWGRGYELNAPAEDNVFSDRPAQKVYLPHCFLGSYLKGCHREKMAWNLGNSGSKLEECKVGSGQWACPAGWEQEGTGQGGDVTGMT